MRFNIMLVDPDGYRHAHFLDDTLKLLFYGLQSLGHECTIRRNKMELGKTNIILGGHLINSVEQVNTIAQCGPYVAIQGEVITPRGLNNSDAALYQNQIYLPFLKRASAVWDGTPHNIPMLHSLGIPATLLLGGYHPALREIRHKQKDIDFLYYGSMTPHRKSMLDAIRERGYQVMEMFDDRSLFRNDLIARTKINLCPIQSQEMRQLPWTRICFLLNNESMIVVEECRDQAWLQDCYPWATTDKWVDLCEQLLHSPQREELTQQYCARFEQYPFVEKLAAVLDCTLTKNAA